MNEFQTPRSIDSLLAQAGWVRALAAHLCANAADADDLAQDAWIAAIGNPPRDRESARAWFRRVIVNLVRARHRSEDARTDRERRVSAPVSDQHGSAVPASDVTERADISRRVAEHVLALDEPYRSTILHRYFDGLSAVEIARQDNVPASTVRTRLERGLDLLRARLERERGATWLEALAPLVVGGGTREVARLAPLHVGGTGAIAGGLIAMSVSKLVVLSVCAALGAWLLWPKAEPTSTVVYPVAKAEEHAAPPIHPVEPSEARVALEPVNAPRPLVPAPNASAPTPDPTETELDRFARTIPAGSIEGIVLRGIVPVHGGRAWLRAESKQGLPWGTCEDWDAADGVRRAEIGANGIFRFDDLSPDSYNVGVRTRDGAVRSCFVKLAGADQVNPRLIIGLGTGGIRGHVYDAGGESTAGWQVSLFNLARPRVPSQLIARSVADTRGAFEFTEVLAGRYLLDAWPGKDPRETETQGLLVDLAAGEAKTVDIGAPHPTIWTGRILTPRGTPLPLETVFDLEAEVDGVRTHERVSRDGSFRMRLAPGSYRVGLKAVAGIALGTWISLGKVVLPHHDVEHDLELPRALVRVRVGDGTNTLGPKEGVLLRLQGPKNAASYVADRGVDGNYYFLAVTPGEYSLASTPRHIRGAVRGSLPVQIRAADDEVELDVVLDDR